MNQRHPTPPLSTLAAIAVALVIALASAVPGAAQIPEGALERCIRDNLTRYSDPARADVNQYVDAVAECRAALDREQGVEVEITPVPRTGAVPGALPGSDRPSTPGAPEESTRSDRAGGAPADAGDPRAPTATRPDGTPAPRPETGLQAAPADPLAVEPASAGPGAPLPGLAGAPAWVLVVMGVAIGLAIGGLVAGARRRFS